MKLFKLDIKDRYRRGLAQGVRTNRSPQSETSVSFFHDHDPHHQAASPTSPSVLFSAGIPSAKPPPDHLEQWNEFGASPLEAVSSSPSLSPSSSTSSIVDTASPRGATMYAQTHTAHPHFSRVGGRYLGRQYDRGYEYDDDVSSDGYISSSSSSSGGSISSSTSGALALYHSDDDNGDGDEDNDGDDEGSDSDYSSAEEENMQNCRDPGSDAYGGDSSSFGYSNHYGRKQMQQHVDYYSGGRPLKTGEHAGLLPPAPTPGIVPMADRDALEQEARQRRWERHIDKRRQSLNGGQPLPAPRRKRRKKAKDLRKQVLLKNAQYLTD